MNFITWILNVFSPFASPFERKVDHFFRYIKSTDSIISLKKKLLMLMQEDLITVNVWLEKKFKGYKYLTKRARKEMYENALFIKKEFNTIVEELTIDDEKITHELTSKGLQLPQGNNEKIIYLYKIMKFLKPGKFYHYIHTASFGKLIRNPHEQKLEGDCNQIVTLYIYLYSLKYDINDLQIKLLPEHVCLHFQGIDIESTSGTFEKYEKQKEILPVTEIISTNLLDLADFREELQKVTPRVMVKSAQLAYALSSLRSLVAKNLTIAYRNLALAAVKTHHFDTALFYIQKTADTKMLQKINQNAASYYLKKNNFTKAKYYANQSDDNDLVKSIKHNEGVYYYEKNQIDRALKMFQDIGDKNMQKACYIKKYNALSKKVKHVKTLTEAKKYKSIYQNMLIIAKKIEDSRLIDQMRDTLKQL